jgi:hypothetical protein
VSINPDDTHCLGINVNAACARICTAQRRGLFRNQSVGQQMCGCVLMQITISQNSDDDLFGAILDQGCDMLWA